MTTQNAKIYTRSGDDGSTSLLKGQRTSKSSARIQAIGEVDEVNSILGLVIANLAESDIKEIVSKIQHALFNIGSNLAVRDGDILAYPDASEIETYIDELSKDLPPLKEFILPGGNQATALCHLARAVCRRGERQLVELQALEPGNDKAIIFLNRLSDLLFVIARTLNQRSSSVETPWDKAQWQ